MKPRVVAVVAIAVVAACGPQQPAPTENASLGGDAVARVGETRIAPSLVARLAATRALSPRDALGLLVDDALAAEGARARGLDKTPAVAWAVTAMRARLVATHLRDDSIGSGPPSDDEIEQLTSFHWIELDLPEQVSVVHALAKRPANPTPEAIAQARAVAQELRAAVTTATSADDFQEKAKAVPHGAVEVIVQPVPPFVEDTRIAAPGNGQMDPAFTTAAFALREPGATSAVVESAFGWHVIRLVDRLPPKRVPFAERRARLTDEIYAARARGAREALVLRLRQAHRVQIAPSADATMALASASSP